MNLKENSSKDLYVLTLNYTNLGKAKNCKDTVLVLLAKQSRSPAWHSPLPQMTPSSFTICSLQNINECRKSKDIKKSVLQILHIVSENLNMISMFCQHY